MQHNKFINVHFPSISRKISIGLHLMPLLSSLQGSFAFSHLVRVLTLTVPFLAIWETTGFCKIQLWSLSCGSGNPHASHGSGPFPILSTAHSCLHRLSVMPPFPRTFFCLVSSEGWLMVPCVVISQTADTLLSHSLCNMHLYPNLVHPALGLLPLGVEAASSRCTCPVFLDIGLKVVV